MASVLEHIISLPTSLKAATTVAEKRCSVGQQAEVVCKIFFTEARVFSHPNYKFQDIF